MAVSLAMVARLINELSMKGAKVIFQDTHVSGHASQEEIKMMYTILKPKYSIPVHGEYRHLVKHAELAESMGIDKKNIFILSSGDVLELSEEEGKVVDTVPCGELMVDGLGVGDVGNIVIRDRQVLSENGIVVVVLTLDKYTNQLLSGPDIVTRGFVYVRESESLIEEATDVVYNAVINCLENSNVDWAKIDYHFAFALKKLCKVVHISCFKKSSENFSKTLGCFIVHCYSSKCQGS